ncbi:MAG: 2-oxoglutarate dehydrogenase E1 component [Planctomycetes bacterium RBG_16_55_9]|nr:MAG: 2-oxoglutarate dehydrogenase E1 component [Planctomycetes bacterium RBG_16_55_9]
MDNVSYIEDLYREWQTNPSIVSSAWDAYFRQTAEMQVAPSEATAQPPVRDMAFRQGRVDSLLWAYRDIGYLYARLNPLGGDYGPEHDYLRHEDTGVYEKLTLEEFNISEADLDTIFFAGRAMKPSRAPLREILKAFQETYCGAIGVEFLHIQNKHIRRWLIEKMESARNRPTLDAGQKRIILEDLLRTEALEQMLGRSFVGQKRFSLEGSEAIIPGLHFLVDSANTYGIEDFVIGTTHRGRLAILSTILHMTPEEIFSRFEENFQAGMSHGTGDVKYHIGYETDHILDDSGTAHISMVANASHLESVDAIVQGKARALQDKKGNHERKRILPILLHGDAAFSGQGVVAEVFNLSHLPGFATGGTIHIIINNQIGFTTPAREGRSSIFPTDAAKALPVPIFHVNGDDPEAVVYVADLALQFRQTFGADCVLDVFCYRRHGHNETDEPSFTHPHMYKIIGSHPGVATIYGQRCAETGVMTKDDQTAVTQKYTESLKQALETSRSEPISQIDTSQGPDWARISSQYSSEPVDTAVAESTLRRIAEHITKVPEDFHIHPILGRILQRKRETFEQKAMVDWSFAEALAFGSLVLEGIPVRLSGEDCVRGTFSQRHLTWWDTQSDQPHPYTALQTLDAGQAEFSVFDSPLSEYSVVGFEYGYSLVRPQALVAWEAQFGDFANGAQVIIDNYIASAQSKWGRSSGLVLLLPHGSEGQGPDHSSAHLERFLQLAAGNNMQICNATTPAQYFHLLRRQVKAKYRIPLILMTPKSLLRHPKVISALGELAGGAFGQVLDDSCEPDQIERVLLCSGKVYYDLLAQREALDKADAALIRIEQLYPFPDEALGACLARYPRNREVTWVQEEPRNYGAWAYMHERFARYFPKIKLRYLGRDESPSSETGSHKQYQAEQKKLVEDALGATEVAKADGKP